MGVWEYRNKRVHGSTEEEVKNKMLERLSQECNDIIARTPPVGAEDKHLLWVKPDKKRGMYLHHWKRQVQNAIRKEKIQNKQQVRQNMEVIFQDVRQRHR